MSAWPVEDETPDGSRVIGVVRRGAQDVWHAHRNGHHELVARTREWRIQRRGTENDGLTAREGTPIRVGEKEGRKSAVTWLGAEREAELARRDAERLRERGWL